ncbi:2Fe-2S iron-sulfur cluster binding domain-containing protein [Rhodobacteraceae bacterium B1Z28]|uniref:2Fe-2S iron-sulfur cluster binding domain-containing protein n=1 Tax=Ruegeria haliotis TaxID=2747601 RepID=A0ABX2PWB0_9RHOB|nr:2Fe-2S iron-sulfur cluster-binding protein [Ruegeria haliotis]NVO58323.1 2Fe-2S iron-sulfur cluster binding domain-containing protein [Ruegeria haliotis]
MNPDFFSLKVSEIRPEIKGKATSVTFDLPASLAKTLGWQAGQHVTLRFHLNEKEQRRSYSISNPPGAPLRITVKRVAGGLVSNHIGDHLKPGDTVDVMPPFGQFSLTPDPLKRRTHYFFGAGSGITPLFAMINAVLKEEPHSVAHLIYGNADGENIIFGEELDNLARDHAARFTLRHVLSAPSLWRWSSPWRKGRVDADAIKAAVMETPPVAQDVQYWICGPGAMNTEVNNALMALDVPANRIHAESFGGAAAPASSVTGIAANAKVDLGGATYEVPVAADQTLLNAILSAGLTPPFSCQSGVCGACKARLTNGRVHMHARMALEDSDVARGDILSCQSVATSDELSISFDK